MSKTNPAPRTSLKRPPTIPMYGRAGASGGYIAPEDGLEKASGRSTIDAMRDRQPRPSNRRRNRRHR